MKLKEIIEKKGNILKWCSLSLCLIGFVMLLIMKKAMKASNGVCLIVFCLFAFIGLFGYWYIDKKSKGDNIIDKKEYQSYLHAVCLSLKSGKNVNDSINECKEGVSIEKVRQDIDSYMNDLTGPIMNSGYREMFEAIRVSKGTNGSLCLQTLLDEIDKKENRKIDSTLGYIAIIGFVIEMIALMICIYIPS